MQCSEVRVAVGQREARSLFEKLCAEETRKQRGTESETLLWRDLRSGTLNFKFDCTWYHGVTGTYVHITTRTHEYITRTVRELRSTRT